MFRSTTKIFRIAYFLSSMSLSFLVFSIFILVPTFESYSLSDLIHESWKWQPMKVCLVISVIMTLVGILSVFCLRGMISIEFGNFNVRVEPKIYELSDTYNPGFREFILSFVLPLASGFSVEESPYASVGIFIFLNILIYFFYNNSSDFLPNLFLSMFNGYSIILVKNENSQIFVLVKTNDIDSMINSKVKVKFIDGKGDMIKKIAIGKKLDGSD